MIFNNNNYYNKYRKGNPLTSNENESDEKIKLQMARSFKEMEKGNDSYNTVTRRVGLVEYLLPRNMNVTEYSTEGNNYQGDPRYRVSYF